MLIQYCTFFLGGDLFGVNILAVQEITRSQDLTPIPHSPTLVKGLINMRGQIVVAIDLRTIFAHGGNPSDHGTVNIILSLDGELISLIADRAGDVAEFQDDSMVFPPNPLDGIAARLIKGVHKMNGRLLHVLEPSEIFPQAEFFGTQSANTRASQEMK